MDINDLELLQRIASGTKTFSRPDDQARQAEYDRTVARLVRLAERGLIRMPAPKKSFMTAGAGYMIAGPCELTADGYYELERHGKL
jgi:hypothetical protein